MEIGDLVISKVNGDIGIIVFVDFDDDGDWEVKVQYNDYYKWEDTGSVEWKQFKEVRPSTGRKSRFVQSCLLERVE